jgi:hypothetical protein
MKPNPLQTAVISRILWLLSEEGKEVRRSVDQKTWNKEYGTFRAALGRRSGQSSLAQIIQNFYPQILGTNNAIPVLHIVDSEMMGSLAKQTSQNLQEPGAGLVEIKTLNDVKEGFNFGDYFFIVVDDESGALWKTLRYPLLTGFHGVAVIVTGSGS